MKKIVSLLVALALFATTAFAAPLSVAASLGESSAAQTVSASASADLDALFGDVAAVPLTDSEAEAVEGEGLFGGFLAIVGVISSVVGGGYMGSEIYKNQGGSTNDIGYSLSIVGGGIVGGIATSLAIIFL